MAENYQIPSVPLQASKLRLSEAFVRQYYRELSHLTKLLDKGDITQEEYDSCITAIDHDVEHLIGEIGVLRKLLPNEPHSPYTEAILKGLKDG